MTRLMRSMGLGLVMLLSAGAHTLAQNPQSEFVPVTPGAMQESIPAAPLVFAAYAFVWVALFAYIVLLWRRLTKVERELADLDGRLRSGKRP